METEQMDNCSDNWDCETTPFEARENMTINDEIRGHRGTACALVLLNFVPMGHRAATRGMADFSG